MQYQQFSNCYVRFPKRIPKKDKRDCQTQADLDNESISSCKQEFECSNITVSKDCGCESQVGEFMTLVADKTPRNLNIWSVDKPTPTRGPRLLFDSKSIEKLDGSKVSDQRRRHGTEIWSHRGWPRLQRLSGISQSSSHFTLRPLA